ncbi:MAG: AMP-binding protein, partial [Candidatus Gastranaerophilales bacterium]|nr:AMP-binding protein [Candidatus Gastranaerophilales bacterium]
NKSDNNIVLISNNKEYSLGTLKKIIAFRIREIETYKQSVVICDENCFSFIINFFAAIFAKKNIYLVSDKQKIEKLDCDYDILPAGQFKMADDFEFPKVNAKEIIINFFTSGTSSQPKCIKKTLFNLISEGTDVAKDLNIKEPKLIAASTTTMCHLFGMTFHLMFPLCNGHIINTDRIIYPDSINIKNCFLVSTPVFLNSVERHLIEFKVPPKYIISAGAKLPNTTFEYLNKNSNVIEIYGSSETGVIAHRESAKEDFLTVFSKVNINKNFEEIEVSSDYIYEKTIKIPDNLIIDGNKVMVQNRTDRVLKVYEKRVSAEEIEQNLQNNKYINNAYCFKHGEKLACIVSLTEKGKDFIVQYGIIKLQKHLKQFIRQYSSITPQKWHFSDEIPMLNTGKIDKAAIEHIFTVNCSFPVILDRKIQENEAVYKLFFFRQCNFFEGHFPNFPIVPGVAQLYLAGEFAKYAWGNNCSGGQLKKIKFTNIIEPDNIIYLNLKNNENFVNYKYYDEYKIYSSGSLPYINVFEKTEAVK